MVVFPKGDESECWTRMASDRKSVPTNEHRLNPSVVFVFRLTVSQLCVFFS